MFHNIPNKSTAHKAIYSLMHPLQHLHFNSHLSYLLTINQKSCLFMRNLFSDWIQDFRHPQSPNKGRITCRINSTLSKSIKKCISSRPQFKNAIKNRNSKIFSKRQLGRIIFAFTITIKSIITTTTHLIPNKALITSMLHSPYHFLQIDESH